MHLRPRKHFVGKDVYDHANVEDFRQPLSFVARGLLRNVMKNEANA